MKKDKLVFLLVDDNYMMIKMMIPMLENLGYQHFVSARDGEEAWEKLNKEEIVHVVLSDLIMPKLDGVGLLNRIRSSERFWDLPFVMITGEEHQTKLMSSMETEVNSYILKPFTPEKLKNEINTVLKEKYAPSPYNQAIQQGREFLQEKSPEFALQFFDKARSMKPLESDPYYFSGLIHEQMGQYEKAKDDLIKCIELKEAHTNAHDLLATIYCREKNYKAEREILEKANDLSSESLERNMALGCACAKTGDVQALKTHMTKAAKIAKGKDPKAYEQIIRVYLTQKGLSDDAEGIYRKYIDPQFNQPRLINKYALIFQDFKCYEPAIYFLNRAVSLEKTAKDKNIPPADMAVYFFNLAVAHLEQARGFDGEEKQGCLKLAENFVKKALDYNPNHREAHKLLNWLEAQQSSS